MIDMKKLRLLWAMLWWLPGIAASADARFQIELIVFAQEMPTTELFEQTRSEIQWPSRVVDHTALLSVESQALQLASVLTTMSRYPAYRPIAHFAWIQSIAANSAGDAVRIQDAGKVLDGFVRVERGDYLTLSLDLEYQPDPERFFRLNEARRIKFDEDHYFDHPKFGVIAKIHPLSD
ncbi:MAG: hypothetical protein Kow0065_15000 [Methylomicrobium sp.]